MERNDEQRIYTVGEVNRLADRLLQGCLLWVEGEVNNCKSYPAYAFFNLIEKDAVLPCVVFRDNLDEVPELVEGLSLLARGRLGIYTRRGQYRLNVQEAQESGEGRLRREFLKLMRKLSEEGLFDQAVKKPLPQYPKSVGLITSLEGAAVRDVATNLTRRFPASCLIIRGIRVQGDQAVGDIIDALRIFNESFPVEALILARGGGSLQDLHPFNTEAVARAIRASNIPVVTGIGHEPDITLADLAADFRASTPTGAAEAVVPSALDVLQLLHSNGVSIRAHTGRWLQQMENQLAIKERARPICDPTVILDQPRQRLADCEARLEDATLSSVALMRSRIQDCARVLARFPREYRDTPVRITSSAAKLNSALRAWWRWRETQPAFCRRELGVAMHALLEREESKTRLAASRLETLSPLAVLSRGYSIATLSGEKRPLTDSSEVKEGDDIEVRLNRGRLGCEVRKRSE
jgi:exodeoxyribonuclease VII large subunit